MPIVKITGPISQPLALDRGHSVSVTPLSGSCRVQIPGEAVSETLTAAASYGPYSVRRDVVMTIDSGVVEYDVDEAGGAVGGGPTTLPALQTVFDSGTAGQKAAFQSSVSGGAPTIYRVTTPYRMIGTGTARQEFGRINIPQTKLPPGAYIKGWAQFAGTRNAASKTHIIGVNDAGGGLYGCVDIFNASLTTANYAGNRVEFWLRVQNTDSVEAGLYGSSGGQGPVSSSAAVNPVLAEINLRGGGLDIAFGGNLAAPATGTVSISQAAPGVVSWTAHGCVANQPVSFSAPPAPLVAGKLYYVVGGSTLLTDSFAVSEIRGGSAITTTASAASITGTAYTEFGIVDAQIEVTA